MLPDGEIEKNQNTLQLLDDFLITNVFLTRVMHMRNELYAYVPCLSLL